jgi:sortase A
MMRRLVRLLGTLMMIAGAGTLAWAVLVWRWEDPFTALYTHYEQRQLSSAYEKRFSEFRPSARPAPTNLAAAQQEIARHARRYRLASHRGEALGRMRIPRLGLDIILVNGVDHDSLKRGPGRYAGERLDVPDVAGKLPADYMPGEGQLVYVAGHRTTYLAPFSHIDRLRLGDRVIVELPYATFRYEITRHRVVASTDLEMLVPHGREMLVLQACHPRFFASHRYLAYATPKWVVPRGGRGFAPTGQQLAAAK